MISLNDQQTEAVERMIHFCDNQNEDRMMLLEGSAGTGKTTCIQRVVSELSHKSFCMTAPTNKATKVLREFGITEGLEGVDCRTIYSLLGLRVQKDAAIIRVEPLADSDVHKYQIVVVDEGSMVNEQLMSFIMEALPQTSTKFIFMGDPMQLPPVGEENSQVFDIPLKCSLTKVMRHDNQILTLATSLRECILNGTVPTFRSDNDEDGGVYTVDHRRMLKHIEKAYSSETYLLNPSSCKTIAWRNAAVNGYNDSIRNILYGDRAAESFVIDERVVATHPVPELANPDNFTMVTDEEGTVVECDIVQHPMFEDYKVYQLQVETEFNQTWATCFVPHSDSRKAYDQRLNELSQQAKQRKVSWGAFWAMKNEYFHDIRPCHSITAHRSQGSTYRSVFVDVEDILANRNKREAMRCLYVACTRASKILILKTR